MQSGESEGRYYDQSFAEICSNSLNGSFNDVSSINDHLGSLSHEKLTDLKGDYLIHSVFSSRESRASSNRSDSFNHRSSRLNSPEKRCNMTPHILSPIGRSKSFQNLHGHQFHGKIYDESFSIGTYSGNFKLFVLGRNRVFEHNGKRGNLTRKSSLPGLNISL